MIGWFLLAVAAQVGTGDSICLKSDACRQVGSVRIEDVAGKETVYPINRQLPWVVENNLLLVPGDWIVIRLEEREGRLIPLLVKAGNGGEARKPAPGEISVNVHAFDKGTLIMEILSRRPEILDYAAMVVIGQDKSQRTSVCSLKPGTPVFEAWRWPIRQIALWSFRPTTEPGCKEVAFEGEKAGN
jgi:hypothetical protein